MNEMEEARLNARDKLILYKRKTNQSNSMLAQKIKTSEHNIHRWLHKVCIPQYAQAMLIEASLPENF